MGAYRCHKRPYYAWFMEVGVGQPEAKMKSRGGEGSNKQVVAPNDMMHLFCHSGVV